MPAIRPEDISNLIRLAYKTRALMARLIAEYRAVDTLLATVVMEVSPDEEGISSFGSQHDLFPRSDELESLASICILSCGVMAFIKLEAIEIAFLRQPPER